MSSQRPCSGEEGSVDLTVRECPLSTIWLDRYAATEKVRFPPFVLSETLAPQVK